MKPDPYKRARSRQYKSKHGLFENQKQSKQQSNLPSNISDEILSLSLDSENQFENECSIFDDKDYIYKNSDNAQNEHKYKYPKNLYAQIYPADSDNKNVFGSVNSILSIEFPFPENDSASLLCIEKYPASNEQITVRNLKLELKKINQTTLPETNMNNSKSNNMSEKLALEDWLDDVL